jgi:anti-sigma factor RsiW
MSPLLHELRFRRDHRWTPPHMSPYLEVDLSARARARLERHTAECPECRGILDELRRMLTLLHSAAPLADVPDIAGAVLLRLHEPAGP